MDKNIVGYCGYIGLISFVAYRPAIASVFSILKALPADSPHRAKRLRGHATRACEASDEIRMTHRRRPDEI
jgi:hypothetical protein